MRCTTYTHSRTIAFFLAALLSVCALALIFPVQAHAARAYGSLCSTYESGNDPACIDSGCAYGAYQMSYENARGFASWLYSSSNSTYKSWGKKLKAAKTVSAFNTAWRSIAKASPSAFFTRQYAYCKKVYYSPAVSYWKKAAPGFDTANYTWALRSVIFSTAIQHGPQGSCDRVFKLALKDLGGWKTTLTEKQLINAIYYERSEVTPTAPKSGAIKIASTTTSRSLGIAGKYLVHFYSCSSATQIGVYDRLHNKERKDALSLLSSLSSSSNETPATGVDESSTIPTYKITYYLNGGTQASSQRKTFTVSTPTFSLKSPSRTGYTFKGWYTSSSYTTKITQVKTGTKKNLKAYAKWARLTSPFKVKVTASTGLNIRSTYSTSGSLRGHYAKGTVLGVNKVYKDWGRLSNGRGWIYLKYTKQV